MEFLKLENISKSFGEVKALINVNFAAKEGEVHALLGENGAGKSTLIKILGRDIKEDSGKILIDGKETLLKNPNDAIRNSIGIVFQDLSLIPELNVANNIFFRYGPVNKFGVVPQNVIYKNTEELFERFEIDSIDPKTVVSELTLSQRQLIEIVKVFAREPKILVLDEATSALTEEKVKWLLKIARNFAKEKKVVIFISHRMMEVQDIADRITVFRNGKNMGVREMRKTNSDEIISLMLGHKVFNYFPEKKSNIQDEIVLETINLSLGKRLKNVNLKLHKGEILGIGGLAGQGQVPLFLSLFGIFKASGEILINNKLVKINNPTDSFSNGIALIPEDRRTQGLIPPLSLKENISLPILKDIRKFGLLNHKKEEDIVLDLMNFLQIKADGTHTLAMNLSGGNQQKVVIAKIMSTKPKIFLMFDITRGVDVRTKIEIFNMTKRLAAEGAAILYYSTTIDELINVCDSVMIMHDAEITENLQGEYINKENIIRASVGEKINFNKLNNENK